MHMVITMSLDAEEEGRGGRIPGVLLSNRFVDATRVLVSEETVVLYVVDQFDKEDTDEAVS